MGLNLSGGLLGLLFGQGRNVVAETAEVFRENAEAAGVREAELKGAALTQFAAEFARQHRPGLFDRAIDGLNRLPRPLMAYGIMGLFVVAMVDPVWFAARMQGLALVPEPLWWLMGAIVSFYFGARYQVQGQRFQASIAETMAMVPAVQSGLAGLNQIRAREGVEADSAAAVEEAGDNPALTAWRQAA